MSWKTVKLGEVSKVSSSKRIFAKQYVESGVPFYRQKEIIQKQNKAEITDQLYISKETYEEIRLKFGVPKKGDLLITAVGSLGIPYLVEDEVFYFKDGNLIWLSEFNESMDTIFLYHWISSDVGKRTLTARTIGSAQAALTIDFIKSFEVPCPPLEIQRRIADILSGYDNLIENNQKQIKLLEEAAQRLYKEWFVDLRFPGHEHVKVIDGVPEGWGKEKLVDITDVQYGYAFDGSLFNADGNGTPIIRIRNIPNGTTNDYTTEEADHQYLVLNGDILVGMDGEFHVNTWNGDTSYLVQRTCRFSPKDSKMKGWLLQAIYEPIKFFEKTVVGATVAHLGKKHIDTIELLTGPSELYVPFNVLLNKRQLLLNQNVVLAEARDRLLPKLMSGEIEV